VWLCVLVCVAPEASRDSRVGILVIVDSFFSNRRPLGSLRGQSPAGTCLHTHADRCARLRQAMLLPVHPLRNIRRSQGHAVSTQIHTCVHTCRLLGPTGITQTPVPSALTARLPPHSPPNLTFALLAEYRGLPVIRPAEHTPRRADLEEYRCTVSHATSRFRRSAGETPSDRSLRGERRRSDGKATTLRSSRADLAVFRGCHEFGTSMRL
jgi:hypothetical protein